MRIGHGYDVHRFAENRKLFIGGVEIPYSMGLDGHSDADVLIHAICDSLLGAAALGDIGKFFPDNDSSFKNIDSKILLGRVMELIGNEGWHVINCDITIAMQRPKLAPYIIPMRECLSEIMEISPARVSVKATTTEKLGFVGRSEGCEVYAVVLLGRNTDFNDCD